MAASMRPPTMAAATRVAQAADDVRRWCQGRANERKKNRLCKYSYNFKFNLLYSIRKLLLNYLYVNIATLSYF